jgi:hypothetical protein
MENDFFSGHVRFLRALAGMGELRENGNGHFPGEGDELIERLQIIAGIIDDQGDVSLFCHECVRTG